MAYSFDAGSNAFLFYEEKDESVLIPILATLLNPQETSFSLYCSVGHVMSRPQSINSRVSECTAKWGREPISIRSFIATQVGCGPVYLPWSVCSHSTQYSKSTKPPLKHRRTVLLHELFVLFRTTLHPTSSSPLQVQQLRNRGHQHLLFRSAAIAQELHERMAHVL